MLSAASMDDLPAVALLGATNNGEEGGVRPTRGLFEDNDDAQPSSTAFPGTP